MKILWWWIIPLGIVLEILYGGFIFGVLGSNASAYEWSGLLGVVVLMMIGGLLVGSRADSRPTIQGALVGAIAIGFYLALFGIVMLLGLEMGEAGTTEPVPWALWSLNHVLKLVGGALGGFLGGTWLKKSADRAAA